VAVIGFFVTVGFGLGFYLLRCRYQFVYGVIELCVALIIIILTFVPQATYLAIDPEPGPLWWWPFSWWGWVLSKAVGISAGIYVMVRALDNIEKGWPQSRWERTRRNFRRIFFGIASH
jgi:hypothetical protein